jgi:hypothetical protein
MAVVGPSAADSDSGRLQFGTFVESVRALVAVGLQVMAIAFSVQDGARGA